MSLDTEINSPQSNNMFRRAYVRRRSNTTGLYEASWTPVTEFVEKFGSISRAIDDTRINFFQQSAINLTLRNDTGAFCPETNPNSLWYGYMTRYRTLVKIEAGYTAADGTELPTDTTLGVFIMNDEIPINGEKNTVVVQCRALTAIFDEVQATDIVGLNSTQTASQLITKIRDHTDGAGNFVFQQFISSGAWTIQSTTALYNPTSTAYSGKSVWEFMNELAVDETFVVYINRTGGFEFRNRAARSAVSVFSLNGLGFTDQNVHTIDEFKEPLNKLFTFFRLKYIDSDTTTSFLTAGSTTTVDPSSTAWKYGSRIYEFESLMLANTNQAQNVLESVANEFSFLKDELKLTANFMPQLEVLDRVNFSYKSYLDNANLWDFFFWGAAWWDEKEAVFEWLNHGFKLIGIEHNLDTFKTMPLIREV